MLADGTGVMGAQPLGDGGEGEGVTTGGNHSISHHLKGDGVLEDCLHQRGGRRRREWCCGEVLLLTC